MRYPIPIAFLLLAACEAEGPITPPLVPSYTLPARAWAGGQLVIRSDSFTATTAMPTVRIGTVDVLVQRQGDTAFVAAVPDSMAGARTVQLTWPARSVTAGSVVIDGVVAHTTIPFAYGTLSNVGTPVGIGGTARALVIGASNKAVALVDLDAGSVNFFGARMGPGNTWEPGATADPEVFLFTTATQNVVERWKVTPPDQKLETLTMFLPDQSMPAFVEYRPGALYAQNGKYPWWRLHSPYVFSLPPTLEVVAEGNDRITLSPRGDRLVANGSGLTVGPGFFGVRTIGAGVVALPSREVVFQVAGLRESYSQAFSRDGDELALTGKRDGEPQSLIVLDANDGRVKHTRFLADSFSRAIAYDPVRPYIYVMMAPRSDQTTASFQVVERSTWKVLSTIALDCSHKCLETIILPSSQNAVYVMARGDNTTIHSLKVSLPPQ